MPSSENWITVCNKQDLVNNSGVCALIDEQQIALFTLNNSKEQKIYAISNWDPIGKANVLYRGLLASVADKTVVVSPLYKQRFCLSSGQCLDDAGHQVLVYPSRIIEQQVQLQFATAS